MNDVIFYAIIFGVVGVVLGLTIGVVAVIHILARRFRKDPDAMINFLHQQRRELEDLDSPALTPDMYLYLENVDGKIMAYEKGTDKFILQGDTHIEVITAIQQKHPEKDVLFNLDKLMPELSGHPELIQEFIKDVYSKLP